MCYSVHILNLRAGPDEPRKVVVLADTELKTFSICGFGLVWKLFIDVRIP